MVRKKTKQNKINNKRSMDCGEKKSTILSKVMREGLIEKVTFE